MDTAVRLTLVGVNRGSGEVVLGEGHIPDMYMALTLVIVVMECRRVHHSCVVWTTRCLCTTYHVHPASDEGVFFFIALFVCFFPCNLTNRCSRVLNEENQQTTTPSLKGMCKATKARHQLMVDMTLPL